MNTYKKYREEIRLFYKLQRLGKYPKIKIDSLLLSKEEKENEEYCYLENRKKQRNNTNARYRRTIDLNFRLTSNLRSRLYSAVKGTSNSIIKLLGCTIEKLKNHLESNFQQNMNWDNYGEWHIDHVPASIYLRLKNNARASIIVIYNHFGL